MVEQSVLEKIWELDQEVHDELQPLLEWSVREPEQEAAESPNRIKLDNDMMPIHEIPEILDSNTEIYRDVAVEEDAIHAAPNVMED